MGTGDIVADSFEVMSNKNLSFGSLFVQFSKKEYFIATFHNNI